VSSAPQKNVKILSRLFRRSGPPLHRMSGSLSSLENPCSQEKGDRTDNAGEDHPPCNVHDHHYEGPLPHQSVVRQLIGLISNEAKKQAQENRFRKRSGLNRRGYHKYDQADEKKEIKENRRRPKDLAPEDIPEVPVIKRFGDEAQPQKIDEKENWD